jgi:hypothetical protein
MSRFGYTLAILAASVLAFACTDDLSTPPDTSATPPPGSTSGSTDTTFDHDNNQISPWDLLERLQEEGPPSFTSHVHSCSKVRYATLGNVLRSVGIDPTNTANLSAGDLYQTGYNALGGPNYANRIRENIGVTTSGASREYDIFAAGADEVIAAFAAGTIARCPGATLFDANNACQPSGVECLLGVPADAAHLDLCNLTVTKASDIETGKRIAVAAMLAAAYTCE